MGSGLPLTVTAGIARSRKRESSSSPHLLGDQQIDGELAREPLHACRDVDGVADHAELAQLLVAHHASEQFAAVNADADLQLGQRALAQRDVVAGERLAHGQRAEHRVLRLPGIGLQRAEQGQEAVADELGHAAMVLR